MNVWDIPSVGMVLIAVGAKVWRKREARALGSASGLRRQRLWGVKVNERLRWEGPPGGFE